MSKSLDDLIDRFSHYIAIISPRFHASVGWMKGHVVKAFAVIRGCVKSIRRRMGTLVDKVIARYNAIPTLVKLQIGLLSLILFFIFWQFLAYEFSQTTFITINLVVAAVLTSATSIIGIRSIKNVESARSEANKLSEQLSKCEMDLDRLKTELFEIRNKDRRQSAVGKGSIRFVDTVKKLKLKALPDAEKMQYVIDALGVCYDITGAIAFARDEETASPDKESADTNGEEAEKDEVFRIAGRFGLSDEPPTTIVTSGDGILGQVVANNEPLSLEKVPAEYLSALSGLGRSRNVNVYALPLVRGSEGRVEAVVEVASFEKLQIVEAWSSIEQQLSEII